MVYLCTIYFNAGTMKSKIKVYVISALVLVSLFWVVLFATSKGFFDVKLPIMNYVQDFHFTDQNGETVDEHTFDGKVYVSEFFFTTCLGICPKMIANMQLVYEKYRDNANFAILSHTSMPEVDSVPVLKKYEAKMVGENQNSQAKWYFVTGNKDSLYRMARQSYLIDDHTNLYQDPKDDFIHSQFFALVDKQKRVRGIYDGLDKEEIARLEKDIANLLEEESNG